MPKFTPKPKPKPVNLFCTGCGKQLNEYHSFFGKEKCSDCEPIYLIKSNKNEIQHGRTGNS